MNAYGVAIDIAVVGNAEGKARRLTVAFEALEKVLLSVERIMAKLSGPGDAAARSGAAAATEWNRAAAAMERASVAARSTAAIGRNAPHAPSPRASTGHGGGMGTLVSGWLGYEAIKKSYEAEMHVRAAETALSINGFSAAQIAEGNRAAIAVQQTNTGVSQVEALETLKTLQSITQKPEIAIAGLPSAEKYAPVFQALGLDVAKSIEAGLKGAEFRGELTAKDGSGKEVFSQATLDGFMQTAANMAILSGGKVGPEPLLQFLRQSGNAGAFSTREGLASMLPVIQSLGASQAGTAMQAIDQQFSSGKMSDGGWKLGVEMGIFSPNPALSRKVGMGQRQILPGGMDPAAQALERTDKTAFVLDYLAPRIEAYNRKMYGDAYTRGNTEADDVRRLAMDAATAQQLSSRIPGGKGIGDIIRNKPQVLRDREAMRERMAGGDPAAKAIAENPEVQVKAFTAAWTAFTAAWGAATMEPVTELLKGMTAALNSLGDWTRANPKLAAFMSELGAGLVTLSAGVYAAGKIIAAAKAVAGGATAAAAAPPALASRLAPYALRFGAAGGVALGVAAAVDAGLDPHYAENERAREIERGRMNAASSRSTPQAGGFVPQDGYGVAPTGPIQLRGDLNLDGKKVGTIVANHIGRSMSGPNSGTTGFDIRTGLGGLMPAN